MKPIPGLKNLPADTCYAVMNSPVGELTIIVSTQGLHAILWDVDYPNLKVMLNDLKQSSKHEVFLQTKQQLLEYFQCKRKIFDVPLVLNGTGFQIQAWNELRKIPYAKTITYGKQAENIGDTNKARAVGLANGQNPIPIIIPCHRVIGSKGQLVGFAGGMDKKAYLLQLEQTTISDDKLI